MNITQTSQKTEYDLIALSNTFQQSLQDGINLAASIIDVSILVTNSFGFITAYSVPHNNSIFKRIIYSRICDHKAMIKNPHISWVSLSSGTGKLYYYHESDSPTDKQLQFIPYIAWMISISQNIPSTNRTAEYNSSEFLNLLINGEFHHHYDAIRAMLPEQMQFAAVTNVPTAHMSQTIREIKNIFNTNMVTVYNQRHIIALIRRLDDSDKEDLRNKLSYFVGMGNEFSDIELWNTYMVQAIAASKIAACINSDNKLAEYLRYVSLDMFHCVKSYESLIALRHPALAKLEAIDSKQNTQYYETLRIFIESGCNTAYTSDKLFLHRNSVRYRLKTIEALTLIDTSDMGTAIALRYGFMLDRFLDISVIS